MAVDIKGEKINRKPSPLDRKQGKNASFKLFSFFDYERNNANHKPSSHTGKVSTVRLTKGVSWSRNVRIENKCEQIRKSENECGQTREKDFVEWYG